MNKADLVEFVFDDIGKNMGLSKAATQRYIESVFECMQKAVAEEGSLRISGFGTFLAKERKERIGRDPRTGGPITIPKARTVTFRASPELREKL